MLLSVLLALYWFLGVLGFVFVVAQAHRLKIWGGGSSAFLVKNLNIFILFYDFLKKLLF